jgi:murein DD-endopeptidase MepM/ murein hydrolase activator NlpD
VVVVSFFAKTRAVVAAVVAIAGLATANPALANSSATADIAAPLREAQTTRPGASGDEEFRRLFATWQSNDRAPIAASGATTGPSAASPLRIGRTAIPSLNPVSTSAMTSGFGMRVHPVLGVRRGHKGIDLASPIGTPVRAPADGVVSRADWFSSYGLFVSLEHGGDIQTRFGHMSRLNVAAGQVVHKGDIIGYVGSTGRSTGPHLHYEVRIGGTAVNPIPYMQGGAVQVATADPAAARGGE